MYPGSPVGIGTRHFGSTVRTFNIVPRPVWSAGCTVMTPPGVRVASRRRGWTRPGVGGRARRQSGRVASGPSVRAGSRGPIWRRLGGAAVSAWCGPGATSQSSICVRKNINDDAITMRFGNARRGRRSGSSAANAAAGSHRTAHASRSASGTPRSRFVHAHARVAGLALTILNSALDRRWRRRRRQWPRHSDRGRLEGRTGGVSFDGGPRTPTRGVSRHLSS